MKKTIVLGLWFFMISTGWTQTVTIKFATLAPEGSTWMKVMRQFSKAVYDSTQGAVKFKIYPGGIQGDEINVLRKIRINQLHSAGFTGVGLGKILPDVRVLDAPFLFRNAREVDYITHQFSEHFDQAFRQKGYVLLGWAEVGFVYIFTNKEVRSVNDLQGVKMWTWEGDQLAETTFRAFGINPIPLAITDVLTSLQTGLIDGVYTAPLACLALQWNTRVSYMIDMPLANSNGAVLISLRRFNKIPQQYRPLVLRLARKYFRQLTLLSRQDNKEALTIMKSKGLKVISLQDQPEDIYNIGRQTRRELAGKLYSKALLLRVEQALQKYRAKKEQE